MRDDFDSFVKGLQSDILKDVRKHYSETVIDHWKHPRNFRILEKPDGYGKITGPCGDTMEIFLTVDGAVISQCTFRTDGCGTSIVCGSITTELARGKTIEEAKGITRESILKMCGGFSPEEEHCAFLASNTLLEAIALYEDSKK
jgi:nitrogen fixation NifU-like protein